MTCPYGHDECEDFKPARHASGNLISCGKTYVCRACGEATPWEMGCDSEDGADVCDSCWFIAKHLDAIRRKWGVSP